MIVSVSAFMFMCISPLIHTLEHLHVLWMEYWSQVYWVIDFG